MFNKKPKFPLPDMGNLSFGELIAEIEKQGLMGHFKDVQLFSSLDSNGEGICITRDYWAIAGTDPTKTYQIYLGSENRLINSIQESLSFLKYVIDALTERIQNIIKSEDTDYLLRKVVALFNVTYDIYIKDRHTREEMVEKNWISPTDTYEKNRNITMTILDGLNLVIENCVVFQNDKIHECKWKKDMIFDELVDVQLLTDVYLYSLASQYYTLLNVSKNSKNYSYCCGVIIKPNEDIPIEGIIAHPVVYTNTLLSGNNNSILPADEEEYLKFADLTEIGKGFYELNNIEFTEVIKCMYSCRENLCKNDSKIAMIIKERELKKLLQKWYPEINIDNFFEHFVLDKSMLSQYVSDTEPVIYKMGCNKYRVEIRPIVKLENGLLYTSYALLDRAINLWYSYLINGGRPYTSIEPGCGDELIDGCSKREKELGDITVDILMSILDKQYSNAKFKEKDVDYDKIFGKRNVNYGDYDIIYYVDKELYLIESKYFSDSYTGNTVIGDYNKLFAQKNNYYKHCRGRYDLVINEPNKMKTYIGASDEVKVHFLFVSSKPLEVEFQDEDKVVTFLSIANFEAYIQGKLLTDDDVVLKPTYTI